MKSNRKRFIICYVKKNQKIKPVTVFAFLIVSCMSFHTVSIAGIGLLMLFGVPLLMLSIPTLLMRFRKTSWDIATLLLASFFIYNLLGYLWTPSFSAYSVYNYVKIIIIVMCLYCHNFNRREKDLLLIGTVISCVLICWFILTGINIGYVDGRSTVAIFGVVQDPNYLGYLFLVPMSIAVFLFLNNKIVFIKIISIVFASLILVCELMTGSRGALLGLLVVVTVCTISQFKRGWTKILFCIIMGVLVISFYGFVLPLLPEVISVRFSVQRIFESRGTGRMDIWLNAWEILKEFPYRILFGFGTGSSRQMLGGQVAHNFIIQLLIEGGIIGTVLFLSFLVIWCRRLVKQGIIGLSVIMGCMAMAMTLSVNTIYYFWVTFVIGIICSDRSKIKQEVNIL